MKPFPIQRGADLKPAKVTVRAKYQSWELKGIKPCCTSSCSQHTSSERNSQASKDALKGQLGIFQASLDITDPEEVPGCTSQFPFEQCPSIIPSHSAMSHSCAQTLFRHLLSCCPRSDPATDPGSAGVVGRLQKSFSTHPPHHVSEAFFSTNFLLTTTPLHPHPQCSETVLALGEAILIHFWKACTDSWHSSRH